MPLNKATKPKHFKQNSYTTTTTATNNVCVCIRVQIVCIYIYIYIYGSKYGFEPSSMKKVGISTSIHHCENNSHDIKVLMKVIKPEIFNVGLTSK